MSCDNRGNVLELNNHKKVLTILEQKIGHFSIFSLENVTKLLVWNGDQWQAAKKSKEKC